MEIWSWICFVITYFHKLHVPPLDPSRQQLRIRYINHSINSLINHMKYFKFFPSCCNFYIHVSKGDGFKSWGLMDHQVIHFTAFPSHFRFYFTLSYSQCCLILLHSSFFLFHLWIHYKSGKLLRWNEWKQVASSIVCLFTLFSSSGFFWSILNFSSNSQTSSWCAKEMMKRTREYRNYAIYVFIIR